jgi:nitrite reductase/ring-hydroxylating ferredoxin subunit
MNELNAGSAAPNGRPLELQPAWRRKFPIDVPEDNYVARRDFTRFLGLTSLAFVVGQFWIGVQSWLRGRQEPPSRQKIATLAQIPVGGSLTFNYPEETDSCLLVRPQADVVLAYDQKCTHLSCAVLPECSAGHLVCPCHHGLFDLNTGRPLAGPPRRPLTRIELEIVGDDIFAVGTEARTV